MKFHPSSTTKVERQIFRLVPKNLINARINREIWKTNSRKIGQPHKNTSSSVLNKLHTNTQTPFGTLLSKIIPNLRLGQSAREKKKVAKIRVRSSHATKVCPRHRISTCAHGRCPSRYFRCIRRPEITRACNLGVGCAKNALGPSSRSNLVWHLFLFLSFRIEIRRKHFLGVHR